MNTKFAAVNRGVIYVEIPFHIDHSHIDEVSYREKTDVLKRQIAEERERRAQIINGDENEYCLEEIRLLKRKIENGPDKMTEFHPKLFDLLKVIYAEENGALSFVLKGDLTFTVKTENIYE